MVTVVDVPLPTKVHRKHREKNRQTHHLLMTSTGEILKDLEKQRSQYQL